MLCNHRLGAVVITFFTVRSHLDFNHFSLWVNIYFKWNSLSAKSGENFIFIIKPVKIIAMLFSKLTRFLGTFVQPYGNGKHFKLIRILLPKLLHCRKYLEAGSAPRLPEINQ